MAKMLIFTVISALLLTGINSLEFKDCGSKLGKFTEVKISNCDTSAAACVLHKKTNASIGLDFVLDGVDKVEKVNTVVHGIIERIPIPFPLPNPDGCKDNGLECPLEKGKTYSFLAVLPVLKAYPKLTLEVKWQLQNEKGENIICVLIPAKIE